MEEIVRYLELGFAVAVAGYLIHWLTNNLSHKLDTIIKLLRKLAEKE